MSAEEAISPKEFAIGTPCIVSIGRGSFLYLLLQMLNSCLTPHLQSLIPHLRQSSLQIIAECSPASGEVEGLGRK